MEALIHMELVVARPTDRDRLLWKVAHVMSYRLVPVQSFLTGFAEAIRSLFLLTLYRTVVLILTDVRITNTAVTIWVAERVRKCVLISTEC